MISRRNFLVGVGSIITAAFVARVTDHIEAYSRPLLVKPLGAEKTLHAYRGMAGDGHGSLITLGRYKAEIPEGITWRDYFEARGERIEQPSDYERVYRFYSLLPEEIDSLIEGESLEMAWDVTLSPFARAYNLLKDLDLGPELTSDNESGGHLYLMDAPHPGASDLWVEAEDDLAVSLLQARLVELGLPVKVVVGDPADL